MTRKHVARQAEMRVTTPTRTTKEVALKGASASSELLLRLISCLFIVNKRAATFTGTLLFRGLQLAYTHMSDQIRRNQTLTSSMEQLT